MSKTNFAGWIALVVVTALFCINHVVVAVVEPDDRALVLALALVNAVSLAILVGPFRQFRAWAWLAIWVEVAATASVAFWAADGPGPWYAGFAALMAVAQIATLSAFRRAP